MRKLHNCYDIFLSDVHLADYKMEEWRRANEHNVKPIPLTKAFSDIEVDIYDYELAEYIAKKSGCKSQPLPHPQ